MSANIGGMPYRSLGRTREQVSLIGLGGYHIGMQADEQESIRIIRTALDNGINFLDNSWDYNDGASEIRVGKALKDGYRHKAFVMTKIDGHTREAANRQLEQSLRRLQLDSVDLLQFHEVIRPEDPDRIFAANGAFEAATAAQQAGKIRYIGFTGHKDPDIHLKMIEVGRGHGFTFDTVQMPLNVLDSHFRSFEKRVLPVLLERGIGVLAMKPLADGYVLKNESVSPMEAFHYVMNMPVSVVITGCESMEILNQALEAARTFRPLGKDEVEELLSRTAEAGSKGEYEPFKTTHEYDATYQNPEWLG